jgi:hypothetical protein
VPSSALWSIVSGLNLGPVLGLKIENEQVVEGNSLVIDTTVTTEQVDLAIEKSSSCVSSGTGLVIIMAVLILWAFHREISLCTFPGVAWNLEEPGVI